MKTALWVLLALVALFFIIGLGASSSPEAQERIGKSEAVARCREDQQRKSLEPAAARTIAGVCERMEADFVAKYGRKP